MLGRTLGHYRIAERIGAGGMGEVYRARDARLERDVAVKVLFPGALSDDAARQRLLHEARAASALNHPNICTVHDVGEAEGQMFVAFELVEGRPLSQMIPAGGLPAETVVRYGMQIADALAHAHARGIIHRDLKSANIMVTLEGRAKVLDFGLAQRASGEELTAATRSRQTAEQGGGIAGTLAYMAPEQLRGQPAGARSDIWSLGVVLYEMAAGNLPFSGATGFEVSSAILQHSAPALPPAVTPGLRAIIQRCLAKEPGERYASAGEVRAALEAIASSATSIDAQTALPAPVPRRGWLVRAAAALGILLVVALFAYVAGVPVLRRSEPPPSATTVAPGTDYIRSANAEANEYLEKGVVIGVTTFDILRARQMFRRALELDPQFAEARAWLGFTYFVEMDNGLSNDFTLMERAEQELRQAIADDPRVRRAYTGLAAVYLQQGRKELARPLLDKVLGENSNDREAIHWLALYHWLRGDYETAIRMAQQNLQNDALFWPTRMLVANMIHQQGDDATAIRENEKILEQIPRHSYALMGLARIHLSRGDLREARATLEQVRPEERRNFRIRLTDATLLALQGDRQAARRMLDPDLLRYLETMAADNEAAVHLYTALGETETALDWLHRTVRNGDERVEWFRRDPQLAPLRDHPRFTQILESAEFRRRQRQQ